MALYYDVRRDEMKNDIEDILDIYSLEGISRSKKNIHVENEEEHMSREKWKDQIKSQRSKIYYI